VARQAPQSPDVGVLAEPDAVNPSQTPRDSLTDSAPPVRHAAVETRQDNQAQIAASSVPQSAAAVNQPARVQPVSFAPFASRRDTVAKVLEDSKALASVPLTVTVRALALQSPHTGVAAQDNPGDDSSSTPTSRVALLR